MNNRNLTLLGLIAAAMIVWAVIQSRVAHQPPSAPSGISYLIQGLNTADITKIVLGSGNDAATLVRRENQFVITSKNDYPAENKQVNSLISEVLDTKTSELVTNNPDNFASLEVADDNCKQAVRFYDKDGKLLTGVLVGKNSPERGGKYVRLPDKNDVYASTDAPWIQTAALDYVDKKIVDIEATAITEVSVRSDAGAYTIKTSDAGQPVLENVPEGKKQNDTQVRAILDSFKYLSLNDIKNTSEGLNFDHTVVCRTKDNTVYTLKVAQKDGKFYLTCAVESADTTPVVKEERKESEEELKKKEAVLLTRENAIKLNKRHQGWVYEIPEWKGKNFVKKFDELIEDKEKPKAEAPAEPPAEQKPGETPAAAPSAEQKPAPNPASPSVEQKSSETPPAPPANNP
jgi:hypothetical protein